MANEEKLGDCVSANPHAFHFFLSEGMYPTKPKIPPNVCPEEMIGGVDHQLVEFQKNIKRAYDWKLIQGTILNRLDSLPMAHCWCEANLDDIGGLWKRHGTLDGRFVFDFTERKGQLFFQSVRQFNLLSNVPLDEHSDAWGEYKHLYHRFEYNPDEAKIIINKHIGTWKFYEFDIDPIDALRD